MTLQVCLVELNRALDAAVGKVNAMQGADDDDFSVSCSSSDYGGDETSNQAPADGWSSASEPFQSSAISGRKNDRGSRPDTVDIESNDETFEKGDQTRATGRKRNAEALDPVEQEFADLCCGIEEIESNSPDTA
eukprot:CAMPEP_0113713412 /NCGR_PEP_ID=MMETSP0038_2-20120614/31983_1 /TAXON_ID=2898 /ORGANISM="Cryptomonas paramecium" /LENGTH=133 /DNA_ID=CAMNT_0000640147 /DNA_START=44 /DNA_END=442 /DNA_ORIENTATION=+ /assembly_acc=CAM_ASM_000170